MIVTVVLNIILIPDIGMIGGAYSLLAGYGVMMIMSFFIGQKHYPIPYSIKRIGFFFLWAFGLFLLNSLISFDQVFLKYSFKVLIFMTFPFYFLFLKRSYLRV